MLVEDDKSLREIYGVRLLAEGYDIVSAGDGEEALAMAIKERPQLIISDVMMPKVSGYDMLDILRSTTETKNIRVIMMTALSSEEQRARAESLGADRYLVKSQVGIEDVVRVVHEVLEDTPEAVQAAPAPVAAPVAVAPPPVVAPTPAPAAPTPAPVSYLAAAPVIIPAPAAVPTPMPIAAPSPLPAPNSPINTAPFTPKTNDTPKPASLKTRIIQPLNDPGISPVNINDLLDKELAKEAGLTDIERPAIETINQERAEITAQLQSFTPPEPTPVSAPVTPTPIASPTIMSSLLPTPGIGAQATVSAPVAAPVFPTAPAMPPVAIPVTQTLPAPVQVSPAPVTTPATPPASPSVQPVVPVTPANPQPPVAPFAPTVPTPSLPEVPSI